MQNLFCFYLISKSKINALKKSKSLKIIFFKILKMQILRLPFTILIVICTVKATQHPCQASIQVPGLFQDSITIEIERPQQQQDYSYPNIIFPNQTPKIALSMNKIELLNPLTIDYQIVTIFGQAGNLLFRFLLPGGANKWHNLKIAFLLISKNVNGIFVAYFLFDSVQPSGKQTVQITEKQDNALKQVNQAQQGDPKIFISSILGLSMSFTGKSLEYNITSLVDKKQEPNRKVPVYSLQFKLQLGSTTVLKSARISYVLYAPSRLSSYKSYFLSVSQSLSINPGQLSTTRHFLPQALTIFPQKYSLIGLIGLQLSASNHFSLSISFQPGHIDSFLFETKSKVDRVSINMIVLGSDMMMACIQCSESYVKPSPTGVFCVSNKECSDDQIPSTDKEGIHYSCKKCAANSFVAGANEKKSCGCKKGFMLQRDGTCKKIEVYKAIQQCSDVNSIKDINTDKCICKKGFQMDQFGFCNSCNKEITYWDIKTGKCLCLPNFQYDQFRGKCVEKGKKCGPNQYYGKKGCQCSQFTIKKLLNNNTFECQQCLSGTYKVEGINECQLCNKACTQCISAQYCLVCSQGFYFKDFKCSSKCGDGIKAGQQLCDDGNLQVGDGCSDKCEIESGYICSQNTNKMSQCQLKSGNQGNSTKNKTDIDINIKNESGNSKLKNQSISSTSVSVASNKTLAPLNESEYKLSISKNCPIYLSSGIVLDFIVKPQKNRTQDQLNNMFKIEISDKRAIPPTIYYSQDKSKLFYIRCFLHYNGQLPLVDFTIKAYAMLDEGIWRSVQVYSKVLSKISRSIGGADKEQLR